MNRGPQQSQAPSAGAIFVPATQQGSDSTNQAWGQAQGLTLERILEALARLLGFPIAQPVPVTKSPRGQAQGLTRGLTPSGRGRR